MIRSVGFVVLLILLSPFSAFAQQGWYPVHVPGGYSDVDIVSDSELAVFQGNAFSISRDKGSSWSQINLFKHSSDIGFNAIKFLPRDTLIIYGTKVIHGRPNIVSGGIILRSIDLGKTWNWNSSFSYSDDLEYFVLGHTMQRWTYGLYSVVEYNPSRNYLHYAYDGRTNRQIWGGSIFDLQNIEFGSDSTGMAINRGADLAAAVELYVSRDWGITWKKDSLALKPNTASVPVVRPGTLGSWYVSNDSELLISTDTGQSWSSIRIFDRNIHEFQFFDSLGYVVLQDADYIIKTTDAGKSWFAQSCYNGRDPITYVVPTSKSVAYGWAENSGGDDIMRIDDSDSNPMPVLSSTRNIDFGLLPSDSSANMTIVVRNVGSKTLTVSGFISDSANVSVAPKTFSVVANDSIPITITYSTRNGAGDDIRFRLLTNTVPRAEVFHVKGSALLPAFKYSSHFVDFGVVQIGERQTKKIRIENIGKTQARFLSPLVGSFLFYSTTPDTLDPSHSEVFSVRFAPELPLTYDAKLVVRTNAATWDTLVLHGTGILTRSANLRVAWEKSYVPNDLLRGTATNILVTDSNQPLVSGVVGEDDSTKACLAIRYDAFGNRLSTTQLHAGRFERESPTAVSSDSSGGGYFGYTPQIGVLGISHVDVSGALAWSDTINQYSTPGLNPVFPVVLSTNSGGESAVLCSGFARSTTRGWDPGQILLNIYSKDGKLTKSETLNGPGDYFASKPYDHETGLDFGTALLSNDSDFIVALALDYGKSNQEYGPFNRIYYNELAEFSANHKTLILSQQDKLLPGKLVLWDTTLIESGRNTDSRFFLQWFDLAGDSLRLVLLAPSTGIDSVYSLAADNDGSLYLATSMPVDPAGEDLSLLHFSATGNLLWQQSFDGLGSGDDIPVKLIVDHGFAYVLVQSADTNGNDWILLKYDSTGKQLFRLRYDGAGHGDDVPRDFAIGSAGAIYVVGGSTNAKGVQQFTVVKYVDSVLAAIEPSVPTLSHTLEARLTSNPWSTATSLEITKSPASRVTVRVLDLLGREYLNRTATANALSLNSSQFPRGFYTIAIEDERGSRKLIKFIRE